MNKPKTMKRVLLLIGTLGCGGLFDPGNPCWEITPPEIYHVWWQEVEGCTGQQRSMEQITWFTVAGDSFPEGERWLVGYWRHEQNAIYITESEKWSEWDTVKHEMLHAILQDGGHSSPFFGVCAAPARPGGSNG